MLNQSDSSYLADNHAEPDSLDRGVREPTAKDGNKGVDLEAEVHRLKGQLREQCETSQNNIEAIDAKLSKLDSFTLLLHSSMSLEMLCEKVEKTEKGTRGEAHQGIAKLDLQS
jgi:hypothetical protein